jgi:hypothetical protein
MSCPLQSASPASPLSRPPQVHINPGPRSNGKNPFQRTKNQWMYSTPRPHPPHTLHLLQYPSPLVVPAHGRDHVHLGPLVTGTLRQHPPLSLRHHLPAIPNCPMYYHLPHLPNKTKALCNHQTMKKSYATLQNLHHPILSMNRRHPCPPPHLLHRPRPCYHHHQLHRWKARAL